MFADAHTAFSLSVRSFLLTLEHPVVFKSVPKSQRVSDVCTIEGLFGPLRQACVHAHLVQRLSFLAIGPPQVFRV